MTTETTTAPAAEATKEPKAPKRNIGFVAREAIMAGKTNQEALDAVKAEFADAETTMASINWYRNDLKKKHGKDAVPTAKSLRPAKEPKTTDSADTAEEKKAKRRGKAASQAATLAAETGALLGTTGEDAGFLG